MKLHEEARLQSELEDLEEQILDLQDHIGIFHAARKEGYDPDYLTSFPLYGVGAWPAWEILRFDKWSVVWEYHNTTCIYFIIPEKNWYVGTLVKALPDDDEDYVIANSVKCLPFMEAVRTAVTRAAQLEVIKAHQAYERYISTKEQ